MKAGHGRQRRTERGRCRRRGRREAGRPRSSGLDKDGLRTLVDQHRDEIKSGVVVLACSLDDKVFIVVGVTPDLTKKVPAGEVVKQLAPIVGGRGGGRPDFAEAGGKDAVEDRRLLAASRTLIEKMLSS